MTITITNVDESFLPAFRGLVKSAKAKMKVHKSKAKEELKQAVAELEAGGGEVYASLDELKMDAKKW